MQKKALIVGCGYLGTAIAAQLKEAKWSVTGTTRSAERSPAFRWVGFDHVRLDLNDPATFPDPHSYQAIVLSPTAASGTSGGYRDVYGRGVPAFLAHLKASRAAAKVVYTSSTGVYSVADGSWVDESTPTPVTSPKVEALLKAERAVRDVHGTVLRLAGLYGPGRNRLDTIRGGQVSVEDSWVNLIHVDDAARAVVHLLQRKSSGELFVGADGNPVSRWEMYRWLASRLGAPIPKKKNARENKNKRISNRKLCESGFDFRYPHYQAGYEMILRSSTFRVGEP